MASVAGGASNSNYARAVVDYYTNVDAGDVHAVLALFDPKSRYQRADTCYEGKSAIERFYIGERRIIGRHTIHRVVAENNLIVVEGDFLGSGHDGRPKQVGFTDWWRFNRDGLVIERTTYLSIGSEYVKD